MARNTYKATKYRALRVAFAGTALALAALTGYAVHLDAPAGILTILGGAAVLAVFGIRLANVLIRENEWQRVRFKS